MKKNASKRDEEEDDSDEEEDIALITQKFRRFLQKKKTFGKKPYKKEGSLGNQAREIPSLALNATSPHSGGMSQLKKDDKKFKKKAIKATWDDSE